jgi:hypothetical protein
MCFAQSQLGLGFTQISNNGLNPNSIKLGLGFFVSVYFNVFFLYSNKNRVNK